MTSNALLPLVGFALWTLLLVLALGATRVTQVLRGKKKANEFPAGIKHGGEAYWRLNRAHMNATENLPIFAAIVLSGIAAGVADARFVLLAKIVLGARIVQSIVHVASGTHHAVGVRFTAYAVQVAVMFAMGLQVTRIFCEHAPKP